MALSPATLSELADALHVAVVRRWGDSAAVENIEQPSLGGSNRTLIFDVILGDQRSRLVSREETFHSPDKPFLPPDAQFHVMQIAHANGLIVPEPVFSFDAQDRLGPGFVTRFVNGTALPRRVLQRADDHPRVLQQLMETLVKLHASDTRQYNFLRNLLESGDPLEAMQYRIDQLHEPHPALELGLRWLHRNRPASRKAAVSHGDFRVGNFLVDSGEVTALLDWECCHLGSPAEDLGWFCSRSWRFGRTTLHAGGMATRTELRDAYVAAGGADIAEAEIRWWEIFGLVRWGMFNILQAYGHVNGRRSPAFAVCGRNVALIEYDLLMTLAGNYD